MNAVKHGLTAATAVLAGEDRSAFEAFVADVVADLAAEGPVQRELSERVGVLMWKRRRLGEAERQVMSELENRYVEGGDAEADDAAAGFPVDPADPLKLVRFMIADEFASEKPSQLGRLEGYEHRISQQIDSTLRLILKLQNRKTWEQASQGRAARQRGEQEQDPAKATQEAAPAPEAPILCETATKSQCGEDAGMDRPSAAPAREHAPSPPPPSLAQNELVPATASVPQTRPPGGWGGRAGVN